MTNAAEKGEMTDAAIILEHCPCCDGPAEYAARPYTGTGASGMEYPDWFVRCSACGLALPKEPGRQVEPASGAEMIVVCWECGRVLPTVKIVPPKGAPGGAKIETHVSCHRCRVSYKLMVEKL